jgi:uncharacterized membrane protein (Fun14 family)
MTSISAAAGGGFFGGLLLGYALKKLVMLIAVMVGSLVREGLEAYHINEDVLSLQKICSNEREDS